MIHLQKMQNDDFEKFKEWSLNNYADELVKSGMENKITARFEADSGFEKMLPDGLQTKDNFLYICVNESDENIGVIWYQKHRKMADHSFICDFAVYENYRRKGYGEQVLKAIEQDAKSHDFSIMGLHVFRYNTPAYNLYVKCGYITVHETEANIFMEKSL